MDLIFFVQQIPYANDNSTESYIEEVLPPHVYNQGSEIEYPKYATETLVDGKGDCEDSAILMAALLDAYGYDTVLLHYRDHMAVGIRMDGFNPYYAEHTPKYFTYEGKRYYHVEGTNFTRVNISSDSTACVGKPIPIGDISDTETSLVRIVPLRYMPTPAEWHIHQVNLSSGGGLSPWT